MDENIRVSIEDRKIFLSEEITKKLTYLLKKVRFYYRVKIDSKSGLDYSFFSDITDTIIRRSKTLVQLFPKKDNIYGINIENLLSLKEQYNKIILSNSNTNITTYMRIWFHFFQEGKLSVFCELIDLIYNMNKEYDKYLLSKDLIISKEDILINMKYFMSSEDIEFFEEEYNKAINDKDIDKMKKLLNDVQLKILEEWNLYIKDIDQMDDEHFTFIGHSTNQTKFETDFYSKYVSCSLFTEQINDTFASGFGFIMNSQNIVGANSQDMYVNNYASEQENLLGYSYLKKLIIQNEY